MDEIDARQQAELDQLHAHAKDKKMIDRFQWAAIFILSASLLLYVNIALISVIKMQAATIQNLLAK